MSNRDELLAVALRCEQALGPDRELDHAVPQASRPSRASIPDAARLLAMLRRWQAREDRDDGPCWHSVPEIGRALLGKVKLSKEGKWRVRDLLTEAVAHGEVQALETANNGALYRATVKVAPPRVPGPKVFVVQRQIHAPGFGGWQWIDVEAFDTKERAFAHLKYCQWADLARINGDGGSGYTMRRPQLMRVIHLVSEAPAQGTGTGSVHDGPVGNADAPEGA